MVGVRNPGAELTDLHTHTNLQYCACMEEMYGTSTPYTYSHAPLPVQRSYYGGNVGELNEGPQCLVRTSTCRFEVLYVYTVSVKAKVDTTYRRCYEQ